MGLYVTAVMRSPCHFKDTYIEARATVKSQVDLTLDAGFPDDVMWLLMDGNHIVYVLQHDGVFIDRTADGMDEEIDRMAADFAMRLKGDTPAALARITREVKRLSKSVTKVNDRQTCFELVV